MTVRGEPATAHLQREGARLVARFAAMASPCEIFLDTDDDPAGEAALLAAAAEAARIEAKFSRYRDDSVTQAINRGAGEPVEVDDETAALLDYAAVAHAASDGRFDLTTGALRRCWRFDGADVEPDAAAIAAALAHVGWSRVEWARPRLRLAPGMELDFGGIGKEYAVDRAVAVIAALVAAPCLVNFGGDLHASAPPRDVESWGVAIEDPARPGIPALAQLELKHGGVATSGDARRFVRYRGTRLGHVLDPRTGWPVAGAPHAVTVVAATCMEAGTLATLAILHGAGARQFLEREGVAFTIA